MSIAGELINSEIVDGSQELVWEIPAIREQIAQRKAKLNARIKGLENPSILNIQKTSKTGLPGRSVFKVTVEADR